MAPVSLPAEWIARTTLDSTSILGEGTNYELTVDNLNDSLQGVCISGNDRQPFFSVQGRMKLSRQKNWKGLLFKVANIEDARIDLLSPQKGLWATILFSKGNEYWTILDANGSPFLYVLDANLGWKLNLANVPLTVTTGLQNSIESERIGTMITIHCEAGALHPAHQPILLPAAIFSCHLLARSILLG